MKVLLVEDDRSISGFITKGLKEMYYAVDAAFDGEEGLHLALSGSYDMIILDIMLPGIDGWEVLESMRKEKVQTPVIILTVFLSLIDNFIKLSSEDRISIRLLESSKSILFCCATIFKFFNKY